MRPFHTVPRFAAAALVTAIAGLVLVAAPACKNGEGHRPIPFELEFTGANDRNEALAGISIRVGDTDIGRTDENGRLHVSVAAQARDRYPLRVRCPSEHVAVTAPSEIVFLAKRDLDGENNSRIEVAIECERAQRVAAVLVHTPGYEGMPVLVDGVETARTGPGGFAHLRVDLPPSAPFLVEIDSSEYPKLIPQNPRRSMSIGQEDGLFVFEQSFSEMKPRREKHRRSKKKTQEPTIKRPIRID